MFGFGMLSLGVKAAIIGGAILASAGALTWYTTHWYNKGWYAHELLIKQEIEERRNNANQGAAARQSCIDSGGVWEITEGKCTGN